MQALHTSFENERSPDTTFRYTSHHCTDLLNVHTQTGTHRDVDAVREVGDEGVVGGPGLAGDVAEYFLGAMEPFYTEI